MFLCEITGNFERFQFFDFKTNFLKNANSSQKTGILLSRVLVESAKIKNATVPYKSVLSKANVETYKTNFPVNFAKFPRTSFYTSKNFSGRLLLFILRVLFPCEYP